jgi:hypothetical protein
VNELRPPRYWPGGSLPERAFIPGRGPRPTALDEPPALYLPAEQWRDNHAYLWGVDLCNHGYAWEAHEAWEGLWRAAKRDATQATFLQGLIQCAAAHVKASMADAAATERVLERGLTRLAQVHAQQGDRYMGLDLARYLAEHAARSPTSDPWPVLWLDP